MALASVALFAILTTMVKFDINGFPMACLDKGIGIQKTGRLPTSTTTARSAAETKDTEL